MYCANCGEKLSSGSEFCKKCGTAPRKKGELFWLFPLLSLAIIAFLCVGIFLYQSAIQKKAEKLVHDGHEFALEGEIESAKMRFDSALALRPNSPQLKQEVAVLDSVMPLDKKLVEIHDMISQKNYEKAGSMIQNVREQLAGKNGAVYQGLLKKVEEEEVEIEKQQKEGR